VEVDPTTALAGDARTDHVDHAEHRPTLAPDLLDGAQGVERLAGLAHRDIDRVRLNDGIAVAELRGRLGVGGYPCDALDQLRPGYPGVVRRAAPENLDTARPQYLLRGEIDAAEVRRGESCLEPTRQGALHGLGLLEDLLAQVVLVLTLLVGGGAPVDRLDALGPLRPLDADRAELVPFEDGDLPVVEVGDLLGVADEGAHVGGHEVLVFADTDHDRAPVAGGHNLRRVQKVDHRDAVRPLDRPESLPYRLGQRRGIGEGDEVGQHLAVGVGTEQMPLREERVLYGLRVVDDPVVHERDAPGRVGVRMGVRDVGDAVGGPSGVADPDAPGEVRRRGRAQFGDLPLDLVDLEDPLVDDGHAGRVVAPVLEASQAVEHHGHGVPVADASDNPAHT
jgi:hypothetical protein